MADCDMETFEFGPFRFDSRQKLLFRGGEIVSLTPKAIDTLAVLIARRGEVVEKDELIKLVWPDSFVEEGGLARNISTLRKALGEDTDYIETIPKRGYRFIAPVAVPSEQTPAAPAARSWRIPIIVLALAAVAFVAFQAANRWIRMRAAGNVRSIAVMPLKNLSNDPEQQYFSDGMSDVLSTNLAKVRALQVLSGSSGADGVVEGTVQRSGGRVRITARLIDSKTKRVLWAEQYEREMSDVLKLQNEIAEAIVREINLKLSEDERSRLKRAQRVSPEAFEEYLKGRAAWNRRTETGQRQALIHFKKAIETDPGYAPAYAGLADAYAMLGSNWSDAMPPREAMPLAREAALKALKLDETLAEAHTSAAYVMMSYDGDLVRAAKMFQRALELNPSYATAHHWYAHCLLASRQPDKAMEQMRLARELDPESLPINTGTGWCYYLSGKYEEAIQAYKRAIEIDPGFPLAHQALGMALERVGKKAESISELSRAVELSGGHPSAVAYLGYAYGASGDRKAALEQLTKLRDMSSRRYVPALYFALVQRGLGNIKEFASALKQAREERSEYLIYENVDPILSEAGSRKTPESPR